MKQEILSKPLPAEKKTIIEIEIEIEKKRLELRGAKEEKYQLINLQLKVPSGRMSDIVRMISFIKTKFKQVDVRISIIAQEGEITPEEYKEKVKETINQLQMEVEKEETR